MSRRALVRASIVSLLLGFALGVPAAGSAAPGGNVTGSVASADKGSGSGGSTSAMRKPTDPLGRKAG